MSDEADEIEETGDPATDAEETEADDGGAPDQATEPGEGTAEQEGAESTADEGDDAEPEPDDEEGAGLQDGDFVRLSYTARTVEGDQLVDTTDEAVAEEEGVADQGEFEPRVVVLGAGHLFETVEADIIGREVGDSGSVTVDAEEAFGAYDESQVRTVTADKIPEDDRYPGAQVQIEGEQGYLETIVGGRARVDFNHPLAGEDVAYEYEILEEVTDQLERAEGLFGMFLDVDLEMHVEEEEVEETRVEQPDEEDGEPETVTETVEKTSLYVESTPQLSMNQQWMFQKQQIAQEIIDKTGVDRIVVQEVLDGMGGMGMPGMMGGMGGMGGGEGAEGADIEEALEEADIDADEIVDEIEE